MVLSGVNRTMKKSNIIMYTTEDGLTKIEATFDQDTVCLSLDEILLRRFDYGI